MMLMINAKLKYMHMEIHEHHIIISEQINEAGLLI